MSLTTAISRTLRCPELCHLICEEIGTDDPQTLFSLSLSCKTFSEPALNMLWYELDDLIPLLRCMPTDLYEEDTQDGRVFTVSFQRSILESDWERFELAASRIHVLTYGDISKVSESDEIYQLDSGIFQSLACAGRGRARMFPRLQKLTWTVLNNDIYPYILLFLSPSIRDLSVLMVTGNAGSDRMRFSLLTSLVSQCPFIHSVKLSAQGNSSTSWRNLFSTHSSNACKPFNMWTGLGYLSLQNIDLGPFTDVIAGLPALTALRLYSCQTADPSTASNVKGLSMLKSLVMANCDSTSCLGILRRLFCAPLTILNMQIAGIPHEPRWAELVDALLKGVRHDTFARIILGSINMLGQNGQHQPIRLCFQTISPLLCFPRLRTFEMYNYCTLDLGEDDITSIVKAWPRLEKFKLWPAKPVSSRLTLQALISFAQHCPRLNTLSLTIDATAIDTNEEKPGKGSCNSRLQELSVHDSPIGDPGRVAAFISDIFPDVTKIIASEDQEKKRKWEEVEKLVPVIAAVRRQEVNHKS